MSHHHPIAPFIDHTLLKADATIGNIQTLCAEAREHGFAAVCINPYWIPTARQALMGSDVKICTVVGFPLGATLSHAKVHETQEAIVAGADEIDVVMNIAAALEAHWNFIEHEVHSLVSTAEGKVVKVILETCYLNEEQIRLSCQACERAGASFVKTSTGFGHAGATVEHVRLMRSSVSERVHVKASAGIRDEATARAMLEAGATRLGTSSGVALVTGNCSTSSY
ncbi:MAG: deoxyribose-phosphate aldolase [Candidatus Methylacidiphilales bacterium]